MTLSVATLETNQVLIRIAASLSFIGSLAIILSYSTMKEFRVSSNRLVFFMSFYDLLGAIGTGMAKFGYSQGSQTSLCQIQATLIHIGLLGGIFWSACMATNLILKFTFNMSLEELKEFEKFYHLFVVVCSVFPAIAMLAMTNTGTPIFGNAQLWYAPFPNIRCWITQPYSSIRIYTFYLPLWIVFAYNLLVYIYIFTLIKSATAALKGKSKKILYTYATHTSLFILAMLITWIWGSLNRIQGLFDPENPVDWLNTMHSLFTPLQGFINFIVYVATAPRVVQMFKAKISKSSPSSGSGVESVTTASEV